MKTLSQKIKKIMTHINFDSETIVTIVNAVLTVISALFAKKSKSHSKK